MARSVRFFGAVDKSRTPEAARARRDNERALAGEQNRLVSELGSLQSELVQTVQAGGSRGTIELRTGLPRYAREAEALRDANVAERPDLRAKQEADFARMFPSATRTTPKSTMRDISSSAVTDRPEPIYRPTFELYDRNSPRTVEFYDRQIDKGIQDAKEEGQQTANIAASLRPNSRQVQAINELIFRGLRNRKSGQAAVPRAVALLGQAENRRVV